MIQLEIFYTKGYLKMEYMMEKVKILNKLVDISLTLNNLKVVYIIKMEEWYSKDYSKMENTLMNVKLRINNEFNVFLISRGYFVS